MKKTAVISLTLLVALFSTVLGQQEKSSAGVDLWNRVTERLKSAKSYSFAYSSAEVKGRVVVSKDALYISQGEDMEIFETKGVRYSYYPKRRKLDIDPIGREGSAAYALFGWIEKIDFYDKPTIIEPSSTNSFYTFAAKLKDGDAEELSVKVRPNGEIFFIGYKSKKVKYVEVDISNLKYNEDKPIQYFTFDPAKRSDLEVTDYR